MLRPAHSRILREAWHDLTASAQPRHYLRRSLPVEAWPVPVSASGVAPHEPLDGYEMPFLVLSVFA
jgi:hypothetical protein